MIKNFTIDRPSAHNAINYDVMDALEKAVDDAADPGIRVFILSGSGNQYFASGGDLKAFSRLKSLVEGSEMSIRMHRILDKIENLPAITIACVNGDAYGGGCEILGAFDIILADEKARFGFTQRNFFLPPGWGGITRLHRRVGRKLLMWLASGSVIDAKEAYESGLADRISTKGNLNRDCDELSAQIVQTDIALLSALKQGIRTAETLSASDSIVAERRIFASFWDHEEHHERVKKFLDR